MIDLKRLRYVIETARYQNITQASAVLHVTQSALTRSIAEVEDNLGFQLFVRLPRGVQTTEAGASFVESAKGIVSDFDNLLSNAGDYRTLNTGRFRLGISPGGYHRFANVPIAELASRYPELTIEVSTGTVGDLAPKLSLGELDAMIGPATPINHWPDLKTEVLAQFHVAAMLRKNHPLTEKQKVSEVDVLGYPIIFPSSVDAMGSELATRYTQNGLPPLKGRYVCDNFELTCDLVDKTDSFAPIVSLSRTFGNLGEKFHVINGILDVAPQKAAFAYSRNRAVTPAVQVFGKLAKTLMKQRTARH